MSFTRVFTLVTAAFASILLSAGAASASTPTTWEKGDTLSTLQVLTYFVGGPLLLIAGIWLIASLINVKAKHYVPEAPGTEVETTGH